MPRLSLSRPLQVCQALEQSSSPPLGLSPLESPSATIHAYDQGNAAASRKQVLPVVKGLLRKWDQRHPAMQPEGHAAGQKARSEREASSPHGARNRDPERDSTGKKDPATLHHQGDDAADEDAPMPPTPMNSLVDGCPLDHGLPKLSAEAVFEKFNSMAMARCSAEDGAEKK